MAGNNASNTKYAIGQHVMVDGAEHVLTVVCDEPVTALFYTHVSAINSKTGNALWPGYALRHPPEISPMEMDYICEPVEDTGTDWEIINEQWLKEMADDRDE